MVMNKREKAEMQRLEEELRMAKALRWPSYEKPAAMTREEIEENKTEGGTKWGRPDIVARGWFYSSHISSYSNLTATYGCSNGLNHNSNGDTTRTQGMGRMFRTKREALMALRTDATIHVASILAGIDAQIETCEDD